MGSQRLRLVFCTEDMDMVVMAMLVLDMAMLPLLPMATLLVVSMARGLLKLSQRLVCTMEDMVMELVWALVWDMVDMDILVLDMLDMVAMVWDMAVDMGMAALSMVKLIYASKSSKVIFLSFCAFIRNHLLIR